ncbi:MAG: AAA family ATPase [Burkholderiales bacterium]|nr:AAA family ATPase [Burkholderiales bacterium]
MIEPLAADRLTHRCDPAVFRFATTAELGPLDDVIGQERAARAVDFGISIARDGYNLFVMGAPGSGKHTLVRRAISRRAERAERPSDWVYVNNFQTPHRPLALALPPGRGNALRRDMAKLVEELRGAIPAIFESDEYTARVEAIDAEFTERHERAFGALGAEAAEQKIALLRTPSGFSFAPVKDGEVMGPEEFAKLSEEEQARIESTIASLQGKLEKLVREVMRWRAERIERVKALNREMTLLAVGHLVDELKRGYQDLPKVVEYLEALQRDVLDHADDFRKQPEAPAALARLVQRDEPSLRRYEVNVLVDHSAPDGSPVVFADHPTYQNLTGRVDHIAQLGTLVTDFNLIKAGALHRANGGYLLIDATKLLNQPFAWEGLKRALTRKELRIESLAEMYSLVSTVSLEPEPIPLAAKVVLFGERYIYYLLQAYDPDFSKLFRVAADFSDDFDRSADTTETFARLVGTLASREQLLPLDRSAVARTVDFGSRYAGDGKKITARLQRITDLLTEADHVAREAGHAALSAEDIDRADAARRDRADRLRERVHEEILRGTLLIDTSGAKVGQVNGLSVLALGDYAFGGPTRITATTRLGEGQVIDIQREVELGGAIHSKGVLILSAFLAARYSGQRPHSLAASLVFEQTYSEVEGDSASLAELCALLSSLADAPIRQSLAVTGSINQLGEVQPIGGVNEKIEGFFDVCRARGLAGDQGVLIPAANIDHLMLRADVVAAAREGKFHVYAVSTVDQAIELLTGVPAGTPDVLGEGPQATINGRVAARLRDYSTVRRTWARPGARPGGPGRPRRLGGD